MEVTNASFLRSSGAPRIEMEVSVRRFHSRRAHVAYGGRTLLVTQAKFFLIRNVRYHTRLGAIEQSHLLLREKQEFFLLRHLRGEE
jgi:hypothetical protein